MMYNFLWDGWSLWSLVVTGHWSLVVTRIIIILLSIYLYSIYLSIYNSIYLEREKKKKTKTLKIRGK